MKIEDFMKKLAAQTAKPKDSTDKAIMKIINSWRKKGTPAYESFMSKMKSDAEYLANQFAKAGVDKDAAWAFVQKEIGPHYDITSQDDLRAEFDAEFNGTMPDEAWRERVFKNVK